MIKHSHKFLKRLMMAFVAIIAIFGLSSCTKSFCTNQDKANQVYVYYGNLFNDTTGPSSEDVADTTDEGATRLKNRTTLYNTLTSSYGYTLPDKAFNAFINDKALAEAESTVSYWTDGTLGSLTDSDTAYDIALAVSLYAGLTYNDAGTPSVASLFTNFDKWYEEALSDESVGVLKTPSSNYITNFKTLVNNTINSDYACITPVDQTFNQHGSNIYIQGKSWGQAFQEFGFLEGLFVWPISYIVYSISEGLGNTAWAQILAIFTVTLLVRLVTIISTYFQSKSQAKQQKIQPLINQLQQKYPQSATDPDQRQALAREQSMIMKQNKVHPFLPLLFMIIQFPLFICVWSALQGSATLASGNFLGLSLTTTVSECFTNYAGTSGALVGIFIFIFMTIANVLSSLTSLWFTSWRTKKFGAITPTPQDPNNPTMDPQKTSRMMTYVMLAFVVFMGWNLPAGMGIYWLIGAIISIGQSVLMELVQTKNRHQLAASTGDGTSLAAIRRSKHHTMGSSSKNKKKKEGNSDKPLWR